MAQHRRAVDAAGRPLARPCPWPSTQPSTTEPLAIFGGTFDPVHYAHLRCAEQARQTLGLETLYLLPAGDPPHKKTPFTTAAQRLDMLRLALVEFPTLGIDERELRRDGPSFMVDTLAELRAEYPQRPCVIPGRAGQPEQAAYLVPVAANIRVGARRYVPQAKHRARLRAGTGSRDQATPIRYRSRY